EAVWRAWRAGWATTTPISRLKLAHSSLFLSIPTKGNFGSAPPRADATLVKPLAAGVEVCAPAHPRLNKVQRRKESSRCGGRQQLRLIPPVSQCSHKNLPQN